MSRGRFAPERLVCWWESPIAEVADDEVCALHGGPPIDCEPDPMLFAEDEH